MKINNNSFINRCLEILLLALFMVILSAKAVKAQNNFASNMLNGLFTPTQSERFFQAGRENFEREVYILNHSKRYLRDDLLQIDSELIEEIDRSEQSDNFRVKNGEYELHRDR